MNTLYFFTLTLALFHSIESLSIDVNTNYGPVRGQQLPNSDVYNWLGLPFAAPPVGQVRSL